MERSLLSSFHRAALFGTAVTCPPKHKMKEAISEIIIIIIIIIIIVVVVVVVVVVTFVFVVIITTFMNIIGHIDIIYCYCYCCCCHYN